MLDSVVEAKIKTITLKCFWKNANMKYERLENFINDDLDPS